ncbi:phage resistance protein [Azospirillum brasilense]|uniref:phage resistance protein n=1 Tax=Azospirillum brasilense TaxID=192 RepID=UPI000E69E17A|nr:phage resistance protein [Azospirillum brasilense]NUB25311.1 phage resistance protein [Azospirillum brasilense]NUB33629.1 phage resistance protein [Azospirillum brasilense]RIW01511.1 phage resistance protein [Azospirillum brasilense]
MTTETRTLIRDLIHIPERVHQGDFVLKLADGLEHAKATVRDYVVTPQLKTCFDDALGFIEGAVAGRTSKAAYLHGSFGSGKSHFMAMLNLLLAGNLEARSIPELAEVVVRHDGWVQGKTFLMVPYHMIGAHDLESAILGQYAEHVRRLHPDAPLPGFYLSESLFDDAQRQRERMGDEAFFAGLNEGKATDGGGDGWGTIDSGLWDAAGFEAAMLEPPTGEDRQRLIGDLVRVYFGSYAHVVANKGQAFVALDEGLAIMSRHAQSLGYDAVILFLDELILWLATHAANVDFVSREGSKLSKLVEALHARPIPLVSFIARQRDLRELVGQNLAGALQLQFADVLKHWEARFHRITLEDRNLPVIAQKRILRPLSSTAEVTLGNAFEEFLKVRREVLDTLLGSTGEEAMFRQVYPFSPALVQALIAVSSVLQRERTALKLMLQLLVDRRDELALGQIIPVGDLFDVIAEGDEPFSDAMKFHFENAKKLYRTKLLPLLERQHGITWNDLVEGAADPAKALALRNDARLMKTLLLAALVPEVEALKALTAPRLAALNHGSVRSPIQGRENAMVLTKLRAWAGEIGEIKITEDTNPVISIQITGVDTDPILANVAGEDNPGNRRRLVRSMLFEMLGLPPDSDGLFLEYALTWRGTRRQVNIVYDNVREMSDERLRNQDGAWSVIFDFPFDEPNRWPADDIARLQEFKGRTDGRSDTIVWLPSFLSQKAMRDLGTLVKLNYLLTGERFADHARHLSAVDRDQARALLTNQRSILQQRMRACLEVAYGIASEPADAIGAALDGSQHLHSLNGFKPALPVGATFKAAFDKLLDQLFGYLYPAHPAFDVEVKTAVLRKVQPEIQRASAEPDGRVFIADKAVRQLVRSIANPLKLGEMGETHFVLAHHWRTHFAQKHAQQGGPMTVKALRGWMDEPQRMGVPRDVQNLVILTYADQTNRSFFKGSALIRPNLDGLDDDLELREQVLPPEDEWREAVRRVGLLFGLTPPELRNAANVAKLVAQVVERTSDLRPKLDALVRELEQKLTAFGIDSAADRLTTARSAQAMLTAVAAATQDRVVQAFAGAALRTSDTAVCKAMAMAAETNLALRDATWKVFETLRHLADHRETAARTILARVGDILSADEHVIALKPALDEQHGKALRLLTDVAPPPPPLPPEPPVQPPAEPPVEPPVEPDDVVITIEDRRNLSADEAAAVLEGLKRTVSDHPDYRLNLSWKIVRKGKRA